METKTLFVLLAIAACVQDDDPQRKVNPFPVYASRAGEAVYLFDLKAREVIDISADYSFSLEMGKGSDSDCIFFAGYAMCASSRDTRSVLVSKAGIKTIRLEDGTSVVCDVFVNSYNKKKLYVALGRDNNIWAFWLDPFRNESIIFTARSHHSLLSVQEFNKASSLPH